MGGLPRGLLAPFAAIQEPAVVAARYSPAEWELVGMRQEPGYVFCRPGLGL